MSELAQYTGMVDDKFAMAIKRLANAIEKNDPDVNSKVTPLMRADSLMYMQQDIMKYAITCHAKHISLHLMPIYCYADLHAKYKKLIKSGKFQKGCIQFSDWEDLPTEQIANLIADCTTLPYPTQYQLDKKK